MTTFVSFGGGRQSTTLALRVLCEPEKIEPLEIPCLWLFADTGAEPDNVYRHVESVFKLLEKAGHKTEIVFRKPREGASETILNSPISPGGRGGLATPPFFVRNDNGGVGMLRRACTKEYKIEPIHKRIREELGYKPRQRIPVALGVFLWIGISIDEYWRVRDNHCKWIKNIYPLIDWDLTAKKCVNYSRKYLGYAPSKSACFFCPYKSAAEWQRLKIEEPDEFAKAVQVDDSIRNLTQHIGVKDPVYVHRSAQPLKHIVAKSVEFNPELSNECTGYCQS